MRVESTSFTAEDVRRLLEELVDHDRELLVRRLERASARLGELAGRMPEQAPSQPQSQEREWNAQEVLAHIAVFSKFYGVVGSKIGKGQVAEFGLAAQVGQRDVFGERLAALPAGKLARMALADHERTLGWLRSAPAADLLQRCEMGDGFSMSAEEVLRLLLCAHLEEHLEQLDRALRPA